MPCHHLYTKIKITAKTIPKIIPPTNEAPSNFLPLSVGLLVVCRIGTFVGDEVDVLELEIVTGTVLDGVGVVEVLMGVVVVVVLFRGGV